MNNHFLKVNIQTIEEESYVKTKFLYLSPSKITYVLVSIAVLLIIASIIGIWLEHLFTQNNKLVTDYTNFFDLGKEWNLPTLFSYSILLLASFLNFVIYKLTAFKNLGKKSYWLALSLIFLYLSFDEALELHEKLNHLRSILPEDPSGFFYYTWVIPYGILVIVGLFYFLPFLKNLPKATSLKFIIAGFVFVFGAVGFELLEGHIVETYGIHTMYDVIFYTTEESMEMLGVIYFIYALLEYICLISASDQEMPAKNSIA